MYIEINSKAEFGDDDAKGKTTWVNDDPESISISRSSPDHLGKPPWHVQVTLSHAVHHSSGRRTGNLVSVIRTAELLLTPEDIEAILNALLKEKLVTFSAKVMSGAG